MRRVRVFFHDKCFDGSVSAAVFSALYRARIQAEAEFEYRGLAHKANDLFNPAEFTGDENAIVDFKYSPDPRITWWFDHHQSAFLSAADAEHFRQDAGGRKFYDPESPSCASFIAHIGRERFGFDSAPVAELTRWSDIIDSASFASAEAAVALAEPALKLTLAIEGSRRPDFLQRLIPDYLRHSLEQLLRLDYVQQELQPLLERHRETQKLMRGLLDCHGGVAYFDLTEYDLEGYNKFIPYALCPRTVYSVGVSRSSFRTKVSVGSNPWHAVPGMINLASLCEQYGGGGHPRVGAISFEPGALQAARQAAQDIAGLLRRQLQNGGAAEN